MWTKWFGFNNGTNAAAQVPQIKKSLPRVIGVWHCAAPQRPRVNITWQRGGKRFFWSLIHPSPVTDKACRVGQCKDDFPRGEQAAMLQCHKTEPKRQRRLWTGRACKIKEWDHINQSHYESPAETLDQSCMMNFGSRVIQAINRTQIKTTLLFPSPDTRRKKNK